MNATMIKGERSKLLAVAVVFAMIACALVAFMPSADAYEPTDVVEGAVTVDTVDELQTALDDATVSIINVAPGTYGSDDPATGYGVYVVDRPVTIQALDSTDKPTIYGTFNIRASGNVVIDGLEINITYTSTTERNAINVLSNDVEIRNCVITMDEDSSNLCNGIMIWPDVGTQKYVIADNTFNGYVSSDDWASVAIAVAENLDLSAYADRFGIPGLTGTSSVLSADVLDVIRNIVSQNTYNDCDWKYSASDYAADAVGERVLGDFDGNYAQSMDYFAVSDDGKEFILLKQTSDKLDLELNADESLIIDANAVYDGTVTGAGAANVTNNGAQIVGNTATVMNFDALTSVIGMSDVTTILLGDDITFEANTNTGTKTVNLNGNDLIVGDYNLNAYNGKIIVPSGSTLSFNGIVKFSATGLDAQAGSTIYYGTQEASFYNTGSPDSTGLENYAFFPDFGTESQVSMLNASGIRNLYTIFHSTSVQGVDVQFGLSTNNVTYDGQPVTEGEFTILPFIFEKNWRMESFVPSVDTEGMTNADVYEDAIRVSLVLNCTDENSTDQAVPIVYLDAIILQRAPGLYLEVPDWNYGDEVPAFTTEAVGVNDEAIAGSWTYEYFLDDVSMGTDASKLLPGDYTVKGTFTPSAYPEGNYTINTIEAEFTVNPAQLDIEFGEVANEDGLFWGTDTDRYMNYGEGDLAYDVAVSDDGKTVSISGGIYYIADVNDGAIVDDQPVIIFGSPEDKGYYALLNIVNPNPFAVTVQVGSSDANTIPGKADGVDNTLQLMIYIGTQLTADTGSMTITPAAEDTGFGSAPYTLDYTGLVRMTTSGYEAEQDKAVEGIAADGFTRSDIGDETMWIAYDGILSGDAEQTYGYLYYDGKLIYSQQIPAGEFSTDPSTDSGRIWYFSFADGMPAAEEMKKVEGYTLGAEGEYTMYISTIGEDFDPATSAYFATATEYIGGNLDSGFEYFADEAKKGIIAGNPDFAKDDVADKTLWFNWYQDVAYDSLTITLYKGTDATGTQVLKETTGEMIIGYHTFYASFDYQLSEVDQPIGTYYVTVYNGQDLVASGTIEVEVEDSQLVIDDPAQDPVLGMDVSDIQNVIIPEAVDGVVSVTGDLIYIPAGGFPGYMEGSEAGYYLAINVNDKGFPWSMYPFVIQIGDKTFTSADAAWDGTHVFYLGADIDSLADPVVKLDLDGEDGVFFNETTVTINTDGCDAKEYEVIFTDEYNDTISYMMYPGEYVDFRYGANVPAFLYWQDENGVAHYFGTQAVISAKYDANGDYTIEFKAVYAAPGHSLQYYVIDAADYAYDGWNYTGALIAYGDEVYAVYYDYNTTLEQIRDDFARYMGALYWNAPGTITEVTFDGVVYTWDADKGLKGSNWVDADGSTLVSAMDDYLLEHIDSIVADMSVDIEVSNGTDYFVFSYGIHDVAAIPEEPTVTIDGIPDYFVTGQEYVFTVSTTAGDMYGTTVLGTGAFTAPAGSYQVWYLENNPENENYGKWMELPGIIFGDSTTGFPLIDTTSYFKVVFSQAGNWDLTVQMIDFDDQDSVLCEDSAKIIVLEASELPEYDVREPRQQGDYDIAYAIVDGELHIYIVSDKLSDAYRNALSETKITVYGNTVVEYEKYLSDDLGSIVYIDTETFEEKTGVILVDYVLNLPTDDVYIMAGGWYADHWFDIGLGVSVTGLYADSIEVDPTELNMTVGDEPATVTAVVGPETAIDKSVTWSVDGDAVTIVDNKDGTITVTAVNYGNAVIKATLADGETYATCEVNVRQLDHIEIMQNPDKMAYTVGEDIDTTGLVVDAVYTDGSRDENVTGYDIAPQQASPSGDLEVVVSYMGLDAEFTVSVGYLTGISVDLDKEVLTAIAGEKVNAVDGMHITATYSNGIEKDVTQIATYTLGEATGTGADAPAFDAAGTVSVGVSFTDAGNTFDVSFQVTVSESAETTE